MRDPLVSLLSAVRRRWRSSAALRLAGRGFAAAALAVVVAFGLASVRPVSDAALLAVGGGLLAVLIAIGVITWRALGARPADARVARFVEERSQALHGEDPTVEPLGDLLVSALHQVEDGKAGSSEVNGFGRLVLAAAARRVEDLGVERVVPSRLIWRRAAEAVAGALALFAAIAVASPMLSRMAEAAGVRLFPGRIEVAVLTGDARVAAGQPLTIRAVIRAGDAALSRLSPALTVSDGSEERTVPMTAANGEFSFAFESVDRTFTYRVSAGPARSGDYTVTALVPARVERIDLHYQYPAFTAQSPRDEPDGGDIYAPAGTRVRLRVHTDKPVVTGALSLATNAGGLQLSPVAERVLEGELTLARDDSYRVGLTDRDGLRSADGTEYFIRLMTDRPPDVRILRPGGDAQITPLEEVAIEARADDDHGIDRFDLVYFVAGREAKVVPFTKSAGNAQSKTASHLLAAEDLKVQPGDVISYYARARDVGRGKRPSETRSDMFFLEVRPFSEEFVAAQSQSLGGVSGDQIDALITAQKEIIAATWSVERRAASGAGRSTADINAIAAAQAELKGRVDQIASRGSRGRRALPFPQQVAPPQPGRIGNRGGADPVAAAASAMARALDQLNGARTTDALPHEMAALQGLLQAQAEVRRREVSQQAGAAGSGMGRQGQDLSALFDKELQRQQRTNYESRASIQEQSERPADTALDKIRDLARRQEELSRKQRDLAASSLAAEERKRQLETLTREQQQLREQAEQLAQQMGTPETTSSQGSQGARGTSPGTGSAGGGQQGGSEMRGAAEQMREAASDLQRQDVESAAQRSQRAASRLRRLEQQLQQDSPEARQRAAGELRLEAQQVADEQRRIAGEAARLEKGDGAGRSSASGSPSGRSGTASSDAWRRLAGEKDALAQRVDELTRSAAASKPDSAEGASALRELEQQKLSSRMREGAARMRDDSSGPAGNRATAPQASSRAGTAEGEQQIARALDQVVDRMGGAPTPGGAEALTRELDRTREVRERLDALGRKLRDAEARQGAASGRAGGDGAEVQRLRDAYARELQQARGEVDRLARAGPGGGPGGASPEGHEWSATDQGTEAFKQDFSKWEALRKEIDTALDRYDQAIVSRAAARAIDDRLNAGGSDKVPEAYRALIARYYESLARKK